MNKNNKFLFFLLIVLVSCEKEEELPIANFEVVIQNTSEEKSYFNAGAFSIPEGTTEPGAAFPGEQFKFQFHAGNGQKLSFATMYVASNDQFFAPNGEGISLYVNNTPREGNITEEIVHWDNGTEFNEEPGNSYNQPLDGGVGLGTEEFENVREISNADDGFTYPPVAENIEVTLNHISGTLFEVTIDVLPQSITPVAPGVWVVHTNSNPLFEEDAPDYGMGLEQLAQDGNPDVLNEYLTENSGLNVNISEGIWVLHNANFSLFDNGELLADNGLKELAETGDISVLSSFIGTTNNIFFQSPRLETNESYTFNFEARQDQILSFAIRLNGTNDIFVGPQLMMQQLWNQNTPFSGDISETLVLWDAGTEINEFPGIGEFQGVDNISENNQSERVRPVDDDFEYPEISSIVNITIAEK